MCRFKWIINVATIFGAIQSLLWIGFALTAGLTYLCLVPVTPYQTSVDFFRVTFVKLYFEGPKCIPDGGYLGQFNQDYREVIDLFTPDRVFALMAVYVVLNAFYFLLSVAFYRNRENKGRRGLALSWSGTTLVLCALDFAFTYTLVADVFTLKDYMNKTPSSTTTVNLGEVSYVPLVLALLSSRFIAIWLWNFIVGAFLFLNALFCRNVIKKTPAKKERNEEKKAEEPRQPAEDVHPSISVMNGNISSTFDIRSHPEFLGYKKSMESVTRFPSAMKSPPEAWSYAPKEVYWHPKPHYEKDWEVTNEGYVSDELPEPEKNLDFDHDLKNFEPGKRKIKIVKPPIGKPVEPVRQSEENGSKEKEKSRKREKR